MVLLWHRRDQHAGWQVHLAPVHLRLLAGLLSYGVHTLTCKGVKHRHISTVNLTMNDCCYT
jgi:hypothetical protein